MKKLARARQQVRRYIVKQFRPKTLLYGAPEPLGEDGEYLQKQFRDIARCILCCFEKDCYDPKEFTRHYDCFLEWVRHSPAILNTDDYIHDRNPADALAEMTRLSDNLFALYSRETSQEDTIRRITTLIYNELIEGVGNR